MFIPVMGTAFTIDTPLKVAKFGISSVISLVDDLLIERVRKHYSTLYDLPFTPIKKSDVEGRSKRITEYLNMVNFVVTQQIEEIKQQEFVEGTELTKYFNLLPDTSPLRQKYLEMLMIQPSGERARIQDELRDQVAPGSVDVNIMTKLDKDNYHRGEKLPPEFGDALSALKGFADCKYSGNIIFSAGLNKRLYSYLATFDCFHPDYDGDNKKEVIIKVSDYRSAVIQGKFLAKKGIWVSEFRVESGLNCGGHAFASNGFLLGPILEEFKNQKELLSDTILKLLKEYRTKNNMTAPNGAYPIDITVQGGILTGKQNSFLLDYYNIDRTGWGTPFLMVPEATCVNENTLDRLAAAREGDTYISDVSPLNIYFQNLRTSTSELAKKKRIEQGKPGSGCPKGFLSFNTEFTEKPICTASTKYQSLKIESLKQENLPTAELEDKISKVMDKSCICHELGNAFLVKNDGYKEEKTDVAVCPGPSAVYFNRRFSLSEMMSHVYDKINLLKDISYPNMFITELRLYIEVLTKKVDACLKNVSSKEATQILSYCANLDNGIDYYKKLFTNFMNESEEVKEKMYSDLLDLKKKMDEIISNKNFRSLIGN